MTSVGLPDHNGSADMLPVFTVWLFALTPIRAKMET
jgi:hypothetical protein